LLGVTGGCGLKEPFDGASTAFATESNIGETVENENVETEVAEDEVVEDESENLIIDQTLKLWSFTPETKIISLVYNEKNPNVNIEFTMVPDTQNQFAESLINAISGGNVPDVVLLESAYVRRFVEMPGALMDLSEFDALTDEIGGYKFARDIASYYGTTKAIAYNATPGGVFYRRSLALEYFGTDEPDMIQQYYMSDMSAFEQAAAIIREQSDGNTYIVGSVNEFINPYFNNRSQPWIIDNRLEFDPLLNEILDVSRRFYDNGYIGHYPPLEDDYTPWGNNWFNGMSDSSEKQIFSYFLPTWGLPYVLMGFSSPFSVWNPTMEGSDTTGDWALVSGPLQYQWGGMWLAAMNDAQNPEGAKDFIKFAVFDEEHLKNWATGVYTNDYLMGIDPTVADELSQSAGNDFMFSQNVNREVTPLFDNSEFSEFLGGQNHYEAWDLIAGNTRADNVQAYDFEIQSLFVKNLDGYMRGEINREEFYEAFKEDVAELLPDLD